MARETQVKYSEEFIDRIRRSVLEKCFTCENMRQKSEDSYACSARSQTLKESENFHCADFKLKELKEEPTK